MKVFFFNIWSLKTFIHNLSIPYGGFMIKRIGRTGLTIIITLSLVEAVLRLAGFEPHQVIKTDIESNPSNAFLYHSNYGLALNPGTFDVTINSGLTTGRHILEIRQEQLPLNNRTRVK
ncbi:MAG: hypothetical protein HKN16_07065 [Saprospiraceae bacterium]|nr:hypothetical protein [Saprospiraceae bacterium]